jgi:voltage-gated potassium channel
VQPDLIYYGYATLVALGANGIAPSTPYARCFSMIEGILGVMYLTVLLGRLVGLHVSQRITKTSGNGR